MARELENDHHLDQPVTSPGIGDDESDVLRRGGRKMASLFFPVEAQSKGIDDPSLLFRGSPVDAGTPDQCAAVGGRLIARHVVGHEGHGCRWPTHAAPSQDRTMTMVLAPPVSGSNRYIRDAGLGSVSDRNGTFP
jgi:hypothetical protein